MNTEHHRTKTLNLVKTKAFGVMGLAGMAGLFDALHKQLVLLVLVMFCPSCLFWFGPGYSRSNDSVSNTLPNPLYYIQPILVNMNHEPCCHINPCCHIKPCCQNLENPCKKLKNQSPTTSQATPQFFPHQPTTINSHTITAQGRLRSFFETLV